MLAVAWTFATHPKLTRSSPPTHPDLHPQIHNAHLGIDFSQLYTTAKSLADVVIPHEYGLDPVGKLSIG
jgi:hypothetical protein